MSACDPFVARLYDADVRRLFEAGSSPPSDLGEHFASCPDCRRAWAEAGDDLRLLGVGLRERPSARAIAEARATMGAALPPPPPLVDWRSLLLWGVCGAGLGLAAAVLAGPLLGAVGQVLLAGGVGAMALTVEMTRQALEDPAG